MHWRFSVALLCAWLLVLCFVPDPRPLGAPEWAVAALRSAAGLGEPAARLIATLALRSGGLALAGFLVMRALGAKSWDLRSLAGIAGAPVLAILALWVNLGFFPIRLQLAIAGVSATTGAIAGLALKRRPFTALGLCAALGALFAWGTATSIHDDLDRAARAVGLHVLDSAKEIPDGDAGHARLIELAFRFAHAQADDPVPAHRAAILALSVILGEEKIVRVARREIDPTRIPELEALRGRITLQGRKDWVQHFWVSAGLTVLSDADRSIAIGLAKELMDATPGGSGFSFADLTADAAGNRFARAATRDAPSAIALQSRIDAGVRLADFVPELRDLPEGLTRDDFQDRYGGLGGAETRRLAEEIERRLAECPGLR